MKIRILGDTYITSNTAYRGLYREEPQYKEEQELFAFWDWYASEAGNGGYVSDVEKANKLVNSYANHGLNYDIIRIEEEEISTNDYFLGIDICSKGGGYSLIASGLEDSNENKTELHYIFELIKNYFKPKLNKNGLFEIYKDANLFLQVISEIQRIRPEMIEEDAFQIYYLYKMNI